jgi:hypothetical protein
VIGARLGVMSMPTFAQPGRNTYCIGEYEERILGLGTRSGGIGE